MDSDITTTMTPPEVDLESKSATPRSGSREKKLPPPPPKSHHGKRITDVVVEEESSPLEEQSSSRTIEIPSSSNMSTPETPFYTPSTTTSSSLGKASQLATDYFSAGSENQSSQPVEPLRRTQSQLKRPPTPPLSRRHSRANSQSKRTLSNARRSPSVRASMPPGTLDFDRNMNISSSRRPASWLLNAPQQQQEIGESAADSRQEVDESGPVNVNVNVNSLPSDETSVRPREISSGGPIKRSASTLSTKRNSMLSSSILPPPPPPPRRSKGSGNDMTPQREENTPNANKENDSLKLQSSNANDILADLSRLQKEVDDLRGHYETQGRKPSSTNL